jgi:hypothetical protein
MSIRPRTLVHLVVVTFLLMGVAGCSNGTASVTNAGDDPSTGGSEGTDQSEGTDGTGQTDDPPCEATASVDGATYHVVQVASQNYDVKPDYQVGGSATDCAGEGGQPMLFHAIPRVDPAWALCGLVDGRWRVFLADDIAVPANSVLARIVVGG